MKKYYNHENKSYFIIFLIIILLLNTQCTDDKIIQSEDNKSFPEFFLSKGSDSDSSYISFQGTIINSDSFELNFSSWAIIEYGARLWKVPSNKTVFYKMQYECSTVFTKTWDKVTFINYLTKEDIDTLQILKFTNYIDTLEITK